jgi:hypothetical protein
MLKRFGTHLRGNVVGYIALFVVLGGSAVALPGRSVIDRNDLRKNVVKSKNIKPNAATGADVNEGTLDFTCPSGKKEAQGYCWDSSFTTSDTWESTFSDCVNRGGQLPSLALLAAASDQLGYTGATADLWAGQSWDDSPNERASALDISSGIPQRQDADQSHPAVCVYPLVD